MALIPENIEILNFESIQTCIVLEISLTISIVNDYFFETKWIFIPLYIHNGIKCIRIPMKSTELC